MSLSARIACFGILISVVYFVGCSESRSGASGNSPGSHNVSDYAGQLSDYAGQRSDFPGQLPTPQNQDVSEGYNFDEAQFANREIIYTAVVSLSVEDFDVFPSRLAQSVNEYGGFIGESNVARMQGERRSGRWVIRVPGTKYASFLQTLSGMGIAESLNEKAEDVTDKFIDLEARIKSGRQLEERVLKLLEDKGQQLENLLTVERELARVRTQIEQAEGQLRLLQSQVAFSSIILTASEKVAFQPALSKSFSERISTEWQSALMSAKTAGENILIWFAAHGIKLLAWLISLWLAWLIVLRRAWKWLATNLAPRIESPSSAGETSGS